MAMRRQHTSFCSFQASVTTDCKNSMESFERLHGILGKTPWNPHIIPWNLFRLVSTIVLLAAMFSSCSTTSNLPEGEFLYTGIKSINVADKQGTAAENVALDEAEGALAYAPNNSFFGSSSLRTPLPIGLWIYNSMVDKKMSGFRKWFFDSFASTPVTLSAVAPDTRVMVTKNLLQNYGYFGADVKYSLIEGKNPKKRKIAYDIKLGKAYLWDSIKYIFPQTEDSILQATKGECLLQPGNQFSVADLQNEKNRINKEFHNNGFYYYRTDYINYYADSINIPGKVKLLVVPDKQMPHKAKHQWTIGNREVAIRQNAMRSGDRQNMMHYDDTLSFRNLNIMYQGKRPPVSQRVIYRGLKFRSHQLYNEEKVSQTVNALSSMNIFSNVQLTFTPRDTTDTCSVLDAHINLTMDKLIDASLEFNITQKSNTQFGPDIALTFAKRNAFHRGETLSMTLRGLYYWRLSGREGVDVNRTDTYEYGIDLGYTIPWIGFPGLANRRYRYPTSTKFSVGFTRSNIANVYRYNRLMFGVDYMFKTSKYISHTFTPLSIDLLDVRDVSTEYLESMYSYKAPWEIVFSDRYSPSMQYTFNYDNSSKPYLNVTTNFTATVKESGNIIAAMQCIGGRSWNEKEKTFIFENYSQFLKFTFELRNRFRLTPRSSLATRAFLGFVKPYGNSLTAPSTDWFYAGGANSIRAFSTRSLGPGAYHDPGADYYLLHSGDVRLELNAEYRFPLFGDLYGALFLDAGNVWDWIDHANDGTDLADMELRASTFFKQIALGTGFGFRYDLGFLVLRLDMGVAIHAPYNTGKSGYYNIPHFWKDGVALHFAVGYPF